ncbi:MAG: DHHW family protein [Bacillota bacterium]|nr:DHHW family protein [Bacillota bacterium]
MKFRRRTILLALIALILLISFTALMLARNGDVVTITDGSTECFADKSKVNLSCAPFVFRGEIYLPIDDILPACGVTMGWDETDKTIVCVSKKNVYKLKVHDDKVIVNGSEKTFKLFPLIHNGIVCISQSLIHEISGWSIVPNNMITEEHMEFVFNGKSTDWNNNGKAAKLSVQPFEYRKSIYIPADEVLKAIGYSLNWNDGLKALECTKNKGKSVIFSRKNSITINNNEYVFENSPVISDNVLYIPTEMLEKMTGSVIYAKGTYNTRYKRDLLEKVTVGDNYRLAGNSVVKGGGITVVDGFGMELLGVSQANALNYAEVINAVSKSVPNVQVYNIAVPTAAEFYAPTSMKVNQTNGIRTIYKNLDESVISINAVEPLMNHANEKIFFKTDHHWTQRGAYYVYREFAKIKGVKVPDINTFENVAGSNFIGSFVGFTRGTSAEDIIIKSVETIERFVPKYVSDGTVFEDMYMTKPLRTVRAVNTSSNSYTCFIGGDAPVTAFHTSAPSDETIVIIKESYGNAFATWAMNNYKNVYVIDPREFNGFDKTSNNKFNIKTFCENVGCNDLVIINYPGAIASSGIRQSILDMTK